MNKPPTSNLQPSASRGYTLIELVVAVGLFALIMTLVSGAYLTIIGLTRQVQVAAVGIDNLSFALETMTRTIRTGTNYSCGGGDCASGASFSVQNSNGTPVTYAVSDGAITQNGVKLTDPAVVQITSLIFSASGTVRASAGEYTQPHVTIRITGAVSSEDSFTVTTGATMRSVDL